MTPSLQRFGNSMGVDITDLGNAMLDQEKPRRTNELPQMAPAPNIKKESKKYQRQQSPVRAEPQQMKSPVKLTILSSEELAEHNILQITKFKVEKKNIKMDPDTYLANLNSKKLASIHSTSIDFDKKFGSDG